MKKMIIGVFVVAGVAFYGGFSMLKSANDVLKQVGISEDEAENFVWWNLSGEAFSYPNSRELKQKPVSERTALVRDICAFAKSYSESEEFRKEYLENREGSKPRPPEKPEPVEEMRSRLKKEGEASIKEMEKSIAQMPAEHQEMMKASVEMMKEQVKSYDDPNNPMFSKDMEQMMMQGYEAQLSQYKTELAEWEKNNPTDPKFIVKKRLEKFMEETKDVDFNAKLVEGEYGKTVFAKREHEMKSANWKLCFRAGKESVDAARASVKDWLDGLK